MTRIFSDIGVADFTGGLLIHGSRITGRCGPRAVFPGGTTSAEGEPNGNDFRLESAQRFPVGMRTSTLAGGILPQTKLDWLRVKPVGNCRWARA
jgi:hypothetical protein